MASSESRNIPFIPAQESWIFIRLFRVYVKWLFRRRFHHVWMHESYTPSRDDKTIYFLNHTSWWDGLIPFILNEYHFRQKARAIMEDKQMAAYPFFKRIGVFSIDRQHPRKAIRTLRYAVESMDRDNASLFIFPEGKILPDYNDELLFENGIGWLYEKCQDCLFVPVTIVMHTMHFDKPELFIKTGTPARLHGKSDYKSRTSQLRDCMSAELEQLKKMASLENPEKHFTLFL